MLLRRRLVAAVPLMALAASALALVGSAPAVADAALAARTDVVEVRDVDGDGLTGRGDVIRYRFTITNSGTDTVNAVALQDTRTVLGQRIPCGPATLASGATGQCTIDYTLTVLDEARGSVESSVTAVGTGPDGETVESPASTTRVPTRGTNAELTLAKAGGDLRDTDANGPDAGDTIPYSFTVTNSGNVPVLALTVDDPLIPAAQITCLRLGLDPDEQTTCTGDYLVTPADVDAGQVVNRATASAVAPDVALAGSNVATATTEVPEAVAALRLTKDAVARPGGRIDYRVVVTNTGTVPLDPVAVRDPLVPDLACGAASLAPSASTTCTGTYALTFADLRTGRVVNRATASGAGPDGLTADAAGEATTRVGPGPELVLTKAQVREGDRVRYSFRVRNDSGVPLTDLEVLDPLLEADDIAVRCERNALPVGAATRCTASGPYRVSREDRGRGSVVNVAAAIATGPSGGLVASERDTVRLPLAPESEPQPDETADPTAMESPTADVDANDADASPDNAPADAAEDDGGAVIPDTGGPALWLGLLGVLLVVGGGLALRSGRRGR